MKRRSIAALLLAGALSFSASATSIVATQASAAGQHARTFSLSGTVVGVNTPLYQFTMLQGTNRYTIMTTSQSRFRFNTARASFRTLRPGLLVSVNGQFRARYRVATMITLRPGTPIPISTVPATANLTSALTNALAQERYALATYNNVVAKFGSILPFVGIIRAETQHVATVTALMNAHKVTVPPSTVTGAVAPATRSAACQLGATIEATIISTYQNGITLAKDYPDVVRAFGNLLDASQYNHLPAFIRCS